MSPARPLADHGGMNSTTLAAPTPGAHQPTDPGTALVSARDLTRIWGKGHAAQIGIEGVDLDIGRGELVAVVGPSGSGKSTLGSLIAGIDTPTSGSLVVDGTRIDRLKADRLAAWRGSRVGIVFQDFHLLPTLTAQENVELAIELGASGAGRRLRRSASRAMLDAVGLGGHHRKLPAQMSGGEQQRVGIARALAGSPRVLLCDEATSALDSRTAQQILALLRDVNEAFGVTIVLITHDMEVVRSACGSAALLEDGRIVEAGRLTDLSLDAGSALGRLLLPVRVAPVGADETHLLLTVADVAHGSAALSQLARDLDVDVAIRAGTIEQIAGDDVGRFQVALDPGSGRSGPVATDAVVRYLTDRNIRVEVLA